MNNYEFERIPQEKFEFVQKDAHLHDKKLETKARGYFADAFLRFGKNKSSVIAAWILLFLVAFALLAPALSLYDIKDTDKLYINIPSYVPALAEHGFMNAAITRDSQNEASMTRLRGIAEETGMNPVQQILGTKSEWIKYRGQMIERKTYTVENNRLFEIGVVYRVFSYEEFQEIQDFQNEHNIQVIYPYVEPKDINNVTNDANLWYKVDSKNVAVLDADGNFQPVYSTNKAMEGPIPYESLRVEGDDGSYIYSYAKSGAVHCRINYYNYYQFVNGHEPIFVLGTNSNGEDLLTAIGVGARFSILFAILVSAINLTIGTIYGAIQGYYGGYVDLVMDRISDVLSGIPFMIVATLFQLHLAEDVGVLGSFLFAFVLTGWIGMSALVRKQFYRFKSQEFVMAARTLGASDWRLMFKHIFPNGLGTIITSCALVIPGVISSETNLTYLGIINLSAVAGTSLGTVMQQGQANMTTSPHAMLWPSLYIALLMICFNLFGNGLRDAFNPTTRGAED